MGENSSIQWTHHTFNPWVGCQRVSPGCTNCYAEAYDKRVGGAKITEVSAGVAMTYKTLRWGPKAPRVRTSVQNWRKPLAWNRAAEAAGERHRVFCASLADVFEDRPELVEWRAQLFDLIDATKHLDWLLLTKRPENLSRMLPWGRDPEEAGSPWPNVWLGTTVEDQQRANERIPELLKVPAEVRFLSCEPLLERVDLSRWLTGVHPSNFSEPLREQVMAGRPDWVIIGGESGHGARPFHAGWARDLLRQCRASGVAPFVKQLGANVRTRNDDQLTGDRSDGGWDVTDDQVEENVYGYREEYQGADVRVRLRDSAGGDMAEWPADLRVREFPTAMAAPSTP